MTILQMKTRNTAANSRDADGVCRAGCTTRRCARSMSRYVASATRLGHCRIPRLRHVGFGVDLVGERTERRQIDGVDGEPAGLHRFDDAAFIRQPRLIVGLGRAIAAVASGLLLRGRQLVPDGLAMLKNTGWTMCEVSTTCSLTS